MERRTVFSKCGQYRYVLWRELNPGLGTVATFIGLNPSTADATNDDPTIRRCIDFARRWGAGGLSMVNLFAFRATDPADLKQATNPVGPRNNHWLRQALNSSSLVIAAWGNHGHWRDRDQQVLRLIGRPILCLGTTQSGQPRHPLYVRRQTPLTLFDPLKTRSQVAG